MCDKTQLAAGSYSKTEMKKHITRLWNTHPQEQLGRSIVSMPSRLEHAIGLGGLALQEGDDYKKGSQGPPNETQSSFM